MGLGVCDCGRRNYASRDNDTTPSHRVHCHYYFFFQERQRYEDERSHHTEAIDKFSQSSSREIEQWIGLVDRVTAELEGARRANEDLKNRIRDADLALASRNFAALRQLLNVDHHSPDDLPAAFSRGMSSLVVSGEHERRDV